jgi:hypothetical protein
MRNREQQRDALDMAREHGARAWRPSKSGRCCTGGAAPVEVITSEFLVNNGADCRDGL